MTGERYSSGRATRRGVIAAAILVLAVALLGALGAPDRASAAGDPLRVAVYVGGGTNADKITATLRACQACGFDFKSIELDDIVQGRLTSANYDVLVLPAGQEDNKTVYANTTYGLGSATAIAGIQAFASAGGGVVGLESGAAYLCQNGGLQLYSGNYTRTGFAGKNTITITDTSFGSGTQQLYRTAGGGYVALPTGATRVAKNSSNQTVIARKSYGSGRVIVCTLDPELRGDSELDWCIWDNWAMSSSHTNSVGAWKLLGRMINWAGTDTATEPTITTYPNPAGSRVAVISTYTSDGGAWPGLLPGISRAIEYSGHVPLAIRMSDIRSGGKLTLANFKVVIFPGGYCYGYQTGLGTPGGNAVKSFATAGGGVMSICAGSYYLSQDINYYGTIYHYLGLFQGTANGELDDIAQYPHSALTPTSTNDAVIGNLGTLQMWYGGGPYFTDLADSSATSVTTYSYTGDYAGTTDAIRFTYGSGHVLMIGTHPEVRNGSDEDWMAWDNYYEGTNTPWVNPDNPWLFFDAALDNWLTL